MKYLNERPLISGLVIGTLAGILIGWLVIGWVIWPVRWVDANPALLREDFRRDYTEMAATLYSLTLDSAAAQERMREWDDVELYVCQLANESVEPTRQLLLNLAQALSPGITCTPQIETETETVAESDRASLGGQIAQLCGVGLLAVALVGGAFYYFSRRKRAPSTVRELPPEKPKSPSAQTGIRTVPLAQFPTEYNLGHDAYDDSFSIETPTGEFLGECGVGISETLGAGTPKKVTAFEVWLFDKNDIRTVTKVIMSDHAYHDDALRAKLAPKGQPALARPGETVVLETASLIINARIVELEYGSGELPEQSYVQRMVVELAAWAKEPTQPDAAAATDFAL